VGRAGRDSGPGAKRHHQPSLSKGTTNLTNLTNAFVRFVRFVVKKISLEIYID